MAGLYQMAVSTFLSFLEILFMSLKTEISGWSNSSLFLITNNLCFIKYWYSCKDTCKNKASVSFVLTLNEADFHPLSPPVVNLAASQIILTLLYVKHMVVTMLVLLVNLWKT